MSKNINAFAVSLFGTDSTLSIRTSKAGKEIGTRATFGNEGATASELRGYYKSEGLKGAELTKKVNDAILNGKDVAWAKAEMTVSALRSKGFIPDYADVSAKGTGATMRFTRPVEPKVVAAPAPATKESLIALLKSMTAEEKAAILATLA